VTVFAGIDLAAGAGTTALATITTDAGKAVVDIQWDEWQGSHDVLPVIAEAIIAAKADVIAIDAPLTLPGPVQRALKNAPISHNDLLSSPYTRAAERDGIWKKLQLRPLPVSLLAGLTLRAIVLTAYLHQQLPDIPIIEVFPTGSLAVWGMRPPRVRGVKGLPKQHELSRAMVQLALRQRFLPLLPSEEVTLLSADVLDALVAALTGLEYNQNRFQLIGSPDEGQIVLPVTADNSE